MRYFFQFIVWFFTRYLTDIPERIFAGFLMWGCLGIIIVIWGAFFGSLEHIFAIFFLTSLLLVGIGLVTAGFAFMWFRYLEWQEEVFNKLKGK